MSNNQTKNIDEKLKNEVKITQPLREYPYEKEISEEYIKVWDASKYRNQQRSRKLWKKVLENLVETNYSGFPKLKKLLDEIAKIQKESQYLVLRYSKQVEDFGYAHVRLIYDDGKIVEPLSKHYLPNDGNENTTLKRTGMKSVSVISESGKALFTLDIVNDKLIYRRRNIPPAIQDQEKLAKLAHPDYDTMDWDNPKRCFILATEGRKVFVWDSGEVTEITDWSIIEPYSKPNLTKDEEF